MSPGRQTPGPWDWEKGGMPAEYISLLLCAGTVIPDWKPLPSLSLVQEALLSLGLPTLPSGVSTSYLQSLGHILLPEKTFPDRSGSCHGSNNSTSIHMCVMSSVDKSQAT